MFKKGVIATFFYFLIIIIIITIIVCIKKTVTAERAHLMTGWRDQKRQPTKVLVLGLQLTSIVLPRRLFFLLVGLLVGFLT